MSGSKFESRRGQVLPLVGVAMVVLLGAAAFATDVGYHQYRQRLQQTATDSAAIAAGQELLSGNSQKAGRADAASNGYADGSVSGSCTPSTTTTCVYIGPPLTGDAYHGNASAVEAQITAPNQTFFERIFNINNVYITTKAVAVLVNENANTCLLALVGAPNFNNATINAPNCGLGFNDGASFHNATVTAAAINCAVACSDPSATFKGAAPTIGAPISDPCPAISYCAYLENNKPTCTSQPTIPNPKSGPVILQPGCYTSSNTKDLSNTDVTFTCGLYVIQTTFNIKPNGNKSGSWNNVTQSCSAPGGVTLYIDTGGSLNMRDVNVNLSAPTSGDFSQYSSGEQNTLVYQIPGNTNTVNFQSVSCTTCNISLTGMLYAPSANMNYNANSGSSSGNGVLVIVGNANFNGGFSGLFSAPGSGSLTIKTAVLGE